MPIVLPVSAIGRRHLGNPGWGVCVDRLHGDVGRIHGELAISGPTRLLINSIPLDPEISLVAPAKNWICCNRFMGYIWKYIFVINNNLQQMVLDSLTFIVCVTGKHNLGLAMSKLRAVSIS